MDDMKVFTTAFQDAAEEDAREERIKARIKAAVDAGETMTEEEADVLEDGGKVTPFELGGRELRALQPTDGQLTLLMAHMGRGQSNDTRFASIINFLLECVREEDALWMEQRLMTRKRKDRIQPADIERVFSYLTGEWFGVPTK